MVQVKPLSQKPILSVHMTLVFLLFAIVVILFYRTHWIKTLRQREYERFCQAVDAYHSRHNAVARMAAMRGKTMEDWPHTPYFENYWTATPGKFLRLHRWNPGLFVDYSYIHLFENDLAKLRLKYYS